jgi:hypothetical protein
VPQTVYSILQKCFHSVNVDNLREVYLLVVMKCEFDYKDLEETIFQKMHLADLYIYRSVQSNHLI